MNGWCIFCEARNILNPKVVLINDVIPAENGGNAPKFCRSTTRREFWISIVEKAIAKICGGYSILGHECFYLCP